jgi:putative SOS response-associated peptidase YedK
MCGRYARFTPAEIYARIFDAAGDPGIEPSYNVAPSQPVLAARSAGEGRRELVALRWGLVPFWAKDPAIGYRTVNARAETVAVKPAFRAALRARRCLIAADGFYEWRRMAHGKQPYFLRLKGGAPFALAGLWERWSDRTSAMESCTIIVTAANALVAPIHDRMPVILDPADYRAWLDPDVTAPGQVLALLRPYPPHAMEAVPVGTAVNRPENDGPHLVEPVPAHAAASPGPGPVPGDPRSA